MEPCLARRVQHEVDILNRLGRWGAQIRAINTIRTFRTWFEKGRIQIFLLFIARADDRAGEP